MKLSNNIKVIPIDAFFRHELTQIEILKNVKTIGKYAFASGVKLSESNILKNVILNEGLEEINDKAFDKLDVKNLTLPKNIKFIHMYAFGYNFKDAKTILNGHKNTYSEEYSLEHKLDFYPLDGFKDLSTKNSFYPYVYDLFNQDIIKGYEVDNIFRPNNQLTRAQAAKMTTITFKLKMLGNPRKVKDVKKISSKNTRNYIYTLMSHEIVKGYDDGFRPHNNVTHEQFSKISIIAQENSR